MLGEEGEAPTFERVQERLVEAWGFLRRMPDREAGWLKDRRASPIYQRGQLTRQELWEQYKVDSDDYDRDQQPTLPGLRAYEVDRMWQALGWIEAAVEQRDRKLLGVVLGQLNRDHARPAWLSAARAIGWGGHPDTLAKRYSRAITAICVHIDKAETRRNPHLEAVKP